jgi:hypothetical protein
MQIPDNEITGASELLHTADSLVPHVYFTRCFSANDFVSLFVYSHLCIATNPELQLHCAKQT